MATYKTLLNSPWTNDRVGCVLPTHLNTSYAMLVQYITTISQRLALNRPVSEMTYNVSSRMLNCTQPTALNRPVSEMTYNVSSGMLNCTQPTALNRPVSEMTYNVSSRMLNCTQPTALNRPITPGCELLRPRPGPPRKTGNKNQNIR